MLLEKRPANIFVKRVSEEIVEVSESFIKHLRGGRIFDTHHKKICEPLKRVLIHWIDAC